MDTIRCPRCQKLLRVDARACGRCGLPISASKSPRRRIIGDVEDIGQPTNPPASPHRAGHYSGLHPEDQPFQSGFFLRIQRSSQPEPADLEAGTQLEVLADEPMLDDVEPDKPVAWPDDELPQPPAALSPRVPALDDYEPVPPVHSPHAPRGLAYEYKEAEHTSAFSALADFPTIPMRRGNRTPNPETPIPPFARPRARKSRTLAVIISASLIFFLLATGLLTLLLLNTKNPSQAQANQPRLIATPGELRVGDTLQLSGSGFDARHILVLRRDTGLKVLDARGREELPSTDDRGGFQLHVPITLAWGNGVHTLQASEGSLKVATSLTIQAAAQGAPSLQLGAVRINLGAGNPGTVSQKTITLSNAGGGRVTWSAHSTVTWLSLNPTRGSFSGNSVLALTVNRAHLFPQAYLGQIIFTQKDGPEQDLAVSMVVNTLPADLVLSTASLAFSGTPEQSPAGQTMVIQNDGGQPLNWTAGSTTSNGGPWLSIEPSSGLLAANTSAILTVNVATLGLDLGVYLGALSFSYPASQEQQVAINLNVNPPPQPAMHISQPDLTYTTTQGNDPAPQSLSITDPGNAPLNWAIQEDINGLTYLRLSATSGTIAPGQSATVSVSPRIASVSGPIKSTLTIIDSDKGTNVPAQKVNVTITITPAAVISVETPALVFEHSATSTDTSTLLIFSNSGSLPLNWGLVESAQVPWLTFDTTSGTLASGSTSYINVRCRNGQLKPGTYTVTLNLQDTDKGTVVATRSIIVTLTISA